MQTRPGLLFSKLPTTQVALARPVGQGAVADPYGQYPTRSGAIATPYGEYPSRSGGQLQLLIANIPVGQGSSCSFLMANIPPVQGAVAAPYA